MSEFVIKKIEKNEIHGVAELEKLCFCCPWSEEALGLLLGESAVGFCAVDGVGRVLAYGGMMCVLDEGEITNIATHPDARRKGLGKAVVSALLDYGKSHGLVSFSLEVRESNLAAIALYEGLGFESVGIRKNFYTKPTENAVIMIKNIGDLP